MPAERQEETVDSDLPGLGDGRRYPGPREQDRLAELRHTMVRPHYNNRESFVLGNAPVGQVQNELWNDPIIASVNPITFADSCLRGTLPRDVPTDPNWIAQWDFHQNRAVVGTNYGTGADSRDFDVDGAEGWWLYNHSGASGTPVIAVIDGGFRVDHLDLIGRWRRNPTEVVDGQDNDGNGYPDDEFGWNFRTALGGSHQQHDHHHGRPFTDLARDGRGGAGCRGD